MSPGSRPSHGMRPTSTSSTPTAAIASPSTMSALPTLTRTSFEEAHLAGRARGRLLAEMPVRVARHAAAGRRALDEADLQQVRLHHLDERVAIVVDRRGHRLDPDGATPVVVDDRQKEATIEPIEAAGVDTLQIERRARDALGDLPVRLHLRVVAHAPQQAVHDARGAARAAGDFRGPSRLDGGGQDP